jgi:hypothetical protein
MTPYGVLEADPARGTMMGNRGCLVGTRGALLRRWQVERWITCVLAFKDRTGHPMMSPGRYTQLFFLDEATACAAGHRPCRECRRADADAFHAAWRRLHPGDEGFTAMDARLHRQRTAQAQAAAHAASLPDGAMVSHEGRAWLVAEGAIRAWSHSGYGARRDAPAVDVTVLTPPSTLAVMAAGWRPRLHESAGA